MLIPGVDPFAGGGAIVLAAIWLLTRPGVRLDVRAGRLRIRLGRRP